MKVFAYRFKASNWETSLCELHLTLVNAQWTERKKKKSCGLINKWTSLFWLIIVCYTRVIFPFTGTRFGNKLVSAVNCVIVRKYDLINGVSRSPRPPAPLLLWAAPIIQPVLSSGSPLFRLQYSSGHWAAARRQQFARFGFLLIVWKAIAQFESQ